MNQASIHYINLFLGIHILKHMYIYNIDMHKTIFPSLTLTIFENMCKSLKNSPLLLCRKICRNCKCGLTEHNVQMNSEENKKVGKLFEDTKYTGLIAKLKTDGIPSYKGNMVTITLPSSSTAYMVPPSASSTVVPPSATAGSVQPAGAAAGPAPGGAQARPQPAPASVTPAKPNKVPVGVSATSANLVPVSKDVPMKSVTYEWAPPVANKYLVRVQTSAEMT